MKRMIYHVPFPLGSNSKSASGIRPVRMYNGFKELGYEIDLVEGNALQRKESIKRIKKNIKNGVVYDFCYSESSTQPTLHTEPYAFVKHPFFEFKFFKYLKKHGVKIGLFYRDIYWCFPEYATSWKKKFYVHLYKYDISKYRSLLSALFVPSLEMVEYVPSLKSLPIYELPSGTDIQNTDKVIDDNYIRIFYVGGVAGHYDLSKFIKVITEFPDIQFTLCCREEEWHSAKALYGKLPSNIQVIHQSGLDLIPYFGSADIGLLFLKPHLYREFAMPFKLFEFIGHGLPILASDGTKAGRYVKENDCGFVVEYDEVALRNFLHDLTKQQIMDTREKVLRFARSQTWEERAKMVADILTRE